MQLRTKILPKTIQDTLVTSFVIVIIPVVYWFELFVVLPAFYKPWSFWYTFHFVLGTYVLVNITSNFVAIVLCDTSIRGRMLDSGDTGVNWRLCAVCESMVPPRSWHCNTCNICILKRDHHCIFTSCCIGHHNQRYFLMFVLFLFVTTLYTSYYNTIFMAERINFASLITFIKITFPLAMLFLDQSINQIYLFLYLIITIACVFTGVLFYYHMNLILKGLVTHERRRRMNEYDLGKKENIRLVLGEKWYLVWLSPFVKSKLPHDGIHWDTKTSEKGK